MKKITKIGVSLMVLSAFAFAPVASYAQLNASLTGDVAADMDSAIDVNVGTSTSADTSVRADSDVNSDTSLNVNSSGVAVVSSAQVSSESDLDIFSANVSAREIGVARVDINSNEDGESEVRVVYRHGGKFLGFIPVTIKSTTVVKARADAEAEIRSRISWWSFLVANENYARADVESRIKNNTTVKANAQVSASAQAKAQIAEAVIAEIAAHASAQASINK